MEGSSGVTRGRGSDLIEVGGVKEALRGFFLSGRRTKGKECGICLGGRSSVELGEEVVGVVLKALLVPPEEEEKLEERRTSLWLCEECGASLKTLTDLFHRLEELRCQFNDLRRIVGSQVILGSLGRSEEEWAGWEEEVKRVEHIFPSCLRLNKAEEDGGAPFCDSLVKEEEMELNEEVNKMIPLVLLGPQIEETDTAEVSDPLWIEEDLHVKSEVDVRMDDTETQNGAHEIHDDLFCEEPLTFPIEETSESSAEVSLRSQRKQIFSISTPKNDVVELSDDSSSAEEEATSPLNGHRIRCKRCAQTFVNKSGFRCHVEKMHTGFKAEDLEETVDSFRYRRQLRKRRLDLNYNDTSTSTAPKESSGVPCSHCHLTFPHPSFLKFHKLRTHLLGSTTSGDPQCPFCLEFYADKPSLVHHQKKIHFGGHSPGPQHIHCFLCRTSQRSREDLKAHEESPEHKQKIRAKSSAYCDVCRLNFAWNPDALRLHLKTPQHQQQVDSLGEFDATRFCILCRKDYATRPQLHAHIRNAAHKQKAREVQENHSQNITISRIARELCFSSRSIPQPSEPTRSS